MLFRSVATGFIESTAASAVAGFDESTAVAVVSWWDPSRTEPHNYPDRSATPLDMFSFSRRSRLAVQPASSTTTGRPGSAVANQFLGELSIGDWLESTVFRGANIILYSIRRYIGD